MCPICEKAGNNTYFSTLGAPARRALENNGILTVKKLSTFSEDELLKLHGIGKSSIPTLRSILEKNGLAFKKEETGKTVAASMDAYIAGFPIDTQKALKQIKMAIKKLVPDAEEKISYGIPTFTLGGRNLIYFAGYKNHIGLYPAPINIEEFKDMLSPYQSGKGTVQFQLDKPIPINIISAIMNFWVKSNSFKKKTKIPPGKDHIVYHKDGSIWAKGKIVADIQEGYWEWFRKDGVIMRSGYFNNGKQVGEWTTYDKNGKVHKVTKMK